MWVRGVCVLVDWVFVGGWVVYDVCAWVYVSFLYLLLIYTIAIVFELCLGGDMMYEIRRKTKLTLLLTQRFFNLPHHIGVL